MLHDQRLKSLPVPTLEQTDRFAMHMADNHSWYKHLCRSSRPVRRSFSSNPNAGRGVKAEGERFVVYDVEHGTYFAHHSRRLTRPAPGIFEICKLLNPHSAKLSRNR